MKRLLTSMILFAAAAVMSAAQAAPIALTFEGLQNQEQILDFYNGGTGSLGSAGPNYGISFGADSLGLIDADNGGSGNFANEPSPDTIAFFLTGPGVVMNVIAGFDTGFSFFYTSSGVASVTVYDDVNGTGNILGILNLVQNWQNDNCTGDPTGSFCHWDPIGVSFNGLAKSVSFSGAANQVGFDNVTLSSDIPCTGPTCVPEPGTLALFGSALFGFIAARRRKA